ncbi:hypothetical protein [Kosakonia sp.]|uniref:hypothetical protein n=1 Tax=Kosakonia sp. TaxID=1916651 RepID=UPI00289CCEA3|nr:hypothetical protein [Kosakonia sp.]
MRKTVWAIVGVLLLIGSFSFGYQTYYSFLRYFWGPAELVTTSIQDMLVANLLNGLQFAFCGFLMLMVLIRRNARRRFTTRGLALTGVGLVISNAVLYSLFVVIHKFALAPTLPDGISINITHQYFSPEMLLSTVIVVLFVRARR